MDSPKPPPSPPPPPAPVRADAFGGEQAYRQAPRRKGLRDTVLGLGGILAPEGQGLGAQTALGSMGTLPVQKP